eukprot:7553786-Ditylum_brightwellii.AAC.1
MPRKHQEHECTHKEPKEHEKPEQEPIEPNPYGQMPRLIEHGQQPEESLTEPWSSNGSKGDVYKVQKRSNVRLKLSLQQSANKKPGDIKLMVPTEMHKEPREQS